VALLRGTLHVKCYS